MILLCCANDASQISNSNRCADVTWMARSSRAMTIRVGAGARLRARTDKARRQRGVAMRRPVFTSVLSDGSSSRSLCYLMALPRPAILCRFRPSHIADGQVSRASAPCSPVAGSRPCGRVRHHLLGAVPLVREGTSGLPRKGPAAAHRLRVTEKGVRPAWPRQR